MSREKDVDRALGEAFLETFNSFTEKLGKLEFTDLLKHETMEALGKLYRKAIPPTDAELPDEIINDLLTHTTVNGHAQSHVEYLAGSFLSQIRIFREQIKKFFRLAIAGIDDEKEVTASEEKLIKFSNECMCFVLALKSLEPSNPLCDAITNDVELLTEHVTETPLIVCKRLLLNLNKIKTQLGIPNKATSAAETKEEVKVRPISVFRGEAKGPWGSGGSGLRGGWWASPASRGVAPKSPAAPAESKQPARELPIARERECSFENWTFTIFSQPAKTLSPAESRTPLKGFSLTWHGGGIFGVTEDDPNSKRFLFFACNNVEGTGGATRTDAVLVTPDVSNGVQIYSESFTLR